MRIRWPIQIVLVLCGLIVASLWLGPPRSRDQWYGVETESGIPATGNSDSVRPPTNSNNRGRETAVARPKSARTVSTRTKASAELDDAAQVEDVFQLIPSACGWEGSSELQMARLISHWEPIEAQERVNDPMGWLDKSTATQPPPSNQTSRPQTAPHIAARNSGLATRPNRAQASQSVFPLGPGQVRAPYPAIPARQTVGVAHFEPEVEQQGRLVTERRAAPTSPSESNHTAPKNDSTEADPHFEIYSRTAFPSAAECATCHKQIYEEWAISQHAYAAISPMFHKFEQKLNDLSQGTVGYFCLRCHAPVATTMGLRRDQPIWDGPDVFREGVTCVACHRVAEQYGKVNGERRIEPGELCAPVFAAGDGAGVDYAIENGEHFGVKPNVDEKQTGQTIHRKAIQFEQLSHSDYCASCHQVAVDPGIKLEVVWDQFVGSPACRDGISCQDCHMGRVPGVAAGYSVGPSAVVNDRVVNPAKKHSNHVFFGPGSSIAHPGVFPFNPDADRWSVNEWLQFNWRAGWGTDEFEERLEAGELWTSFPPAWQNVDDRYDAREVLDDNLKALDYKNELRRQVMENGSHLDGPFLADQPRCGEDLRLHYVVANTNSGHNLPSGSLGAQPQVWLNVVLIGPDGSHRWESGYLDSQGDLADLHSQDVLERRIPHDRQLFNLQSKFLTTNVKGTDREMYLPINVDIDQLPFIRPGAQPVSVLNHPPFIRMEGHSLPPLGQRNASYVIPGSVITDPGPYRLAVRLRSRVEPLYFMRFVDATPEMQRAMIESIVDSHSYSVQFYVE